MIDTLEQIENNKRVFLELLQDVDPEFIKWRPKKDKWCLLEILCHLYDEEREDFRFRDKVVVRESR